MKEDWRGRHGMKEYGRWDDGKGVGMEGCSEGWKDVERDERL